MKNTKILSFILLFTITILMSGCGKKVDKGFVVAIPTDFVSISPASDFSAISKSVLRNMNGYLYKYDTTKKTYIFDMAQSIDVNKNVYDIKIKPNMKFHNGEIVKASDVLYSLNRVSGHVTDFTMQDKDWSSLLDSSEGAKMEVVNDLELKIAFNPKSFSTRVIYDLSDVPIVPADVSEKVQKETPVGAGPYKFSKYIFGDSITFNRFDDYYGDKPSIPTVVFKIMPDTATQLLAFQNNEVNFVSINGKDRANFVPKDGQTVFKVDANDINALYMNFNFAPFADVDIRKAFNYAIDKDRVMKISTNGVGKSVDSHMSPVIGDIYNSSLNNTYTYDIAKGQEIMKSKGYNDNNKLKVDLKVVAENPTNNDMSVLIKENLSKIYVDVNIISVPWSQYLPDVYLKHNYQLTLLQIAGYSDPYKILSIYTTANTGNMPSYKSEIYDKTLESTLTDDDKTRVNDFKKAQQILVDDAVAVFLGDEGNEIVLNKGYDGYVSYPFWFIDVSKIQIK